MNIFQWCELLGVGLSFSSFGEVGTCFPLFFLALYAAAFFLECFRIWRESRALRLVSFLTLLGGFLIHSFWLAERFVSGEQHSAVGAGEWFFALAWGVTLLDVLLFLFYPKTPFGPFLLPAVFLAVPAGAVLAGNSFPVAGAALGAVHGVSLLTATVFLFFGFITGVMFFLQRAKIRSRSGFLRGVHFPSLEWLQKVNRLSVRLSLLFLGIGVFCGILLKYLSTAAGARSSADLMILGGIFLFFLLAAVLLAVSTTDQSRSDTRIALLSILSFLILSGILGYGMMNSRAHWLFPRSGSAGSNIENEETVR